MLYNFCPADCEDDNVKTVKRGRYSFLPLSEPVGNFLDEESRMGLVVIAGRLRSNLETREEYAKAIRKTIRAGMNSSRTPIKASGLDLLNSASALIDDVMSVIRRKG
jgi:hypothetical protein